MRGRKRGSTRSRISRHAALERDPGQAGDLRRDKLVAAEALHGHDPQTHCPDCRVGGPSGPSVPFTASTRTRANVYIPTAGPLGPLRCIRTPQAETDSEKSLVPVLTEP